MSPAAQDIASTLFLLLIFGSLGLALVAWVLAVLLGAWDSLWGDWPEACGPFTDERSAHDWVLTDTYPHATGDTRPCVHDTAGDH